MKTTLKIFLFLVVAFGFSGTAMAQTLSPAATASATLITPLTVAKDYDLSFATVASSGTSGTVVVDHSNASTVTGGVSKVTGTPSTAQFTVTGEVSKTFTLTYPSTINLSKGSGTDLVVTLSCDTTSPATLPSSSPYTKVIKLGGSLAIPANTPSGTYTNTTDLKITVNYQ